MQTVYNFCLIQCSYEGGSGGGVNSEIIKYIISMEMFLHNSGQ